MTGFEGCIKGVGSVYLIEAPFDIAMSMLDEHSLKLISAKQLAIARMQHGANSSLSLTGSLVKEGNLYFPKRLAGKEAIILFKDSLALQNPKDATDAHRKGNEYFVDNDKAMKLLEKAKKGDNSCLLLKSIEIEAIPTDSFGKEQVPFFLFGNKAKDYGVFLKDNGVTAMPLYFNSAKHINKRKGAYANQLILGGLKDYSGIFGRSFLDCEGMAARGVESHTQGAVIEAYTPTQIRKALVIAGFSGLESKLIETLRKK